MGSSVFASLVLLALLSLPALHFARGELFNLTHNPIRFDRRNRMVYAFLYNKEVVAAPWDDIFFCACDGSTLIGGVERDIRGHILAEDGETLMAIFALGHRQFYFGRGAHYEDLELHEYWNFINCYMEKGPEELVSMVKVYLPIAEQKEPPMWGLNAVYN